MKNHWYFWDKKSLFGHLKTRNFGLSQEEAELRLKEYGPNKLPEAKAESVFLIFLRQFQSPLIYILLGAGLLVLLTKEFVDAVAIFFILLFNAVVGTFQEGKAQNTLSALKKMTETKTSVLRGNKEKIIFDRELVPGDIIILKEGEKVPADARVIESTGLKVDEAILTGESVPVHKISKSLKKEVNSAETLPLAEQTNIIFKGTNIVAGSGRAVVVATGLATAIGQISKEIVALDTEVPLKANIRYLSKLIIVFVCIFTLIIFLLGLISGYTPREMFAIVVSVAVSSIPEGLPVVVTLVLASGVLRMSKRKALVKKLQAVETLGETKIIAVDKTGTITQNELMVQKVFIGGIDYQVKGAGYEPSGSIHQFRRNLGEESWQKINGKILDDRGLALAGEISALSSNAILVYSAEKKDWQITGDPTEAAMSVFAQKLGYHQEELEKNLSKIKELPFDYKTKIHALLYKKEGKPFLFVTGAPEEVLARCRFFRQKDGSLPMALEIKEKLKNKVVSMSQEGLRVIALAWSEKPLDNLEEEKIKDLTFIGFLGMRDTLRAEVLRSVKETEEAGIKVVMITGDHRLTAKAVAKEAGIFKKGDEVLSGEEIEKLNKNVLADRLAKVSVFARVTPEHKLKIIEAYRQRGDIVAMTGDGVNDAPSLVAADLGVAMGGIGTEVAKEAADIVLLDDNFKTIVAAVEEGRNIYRTIKKVVLYLFSTSAGEILTIIMALILQYPLPILAAQIIWLNLVTDGFLAVALALEPKEEGLLKGSFKRPKKHLIDLTMFIRVLVMAVPMMLGTLFLFRGYINDGDMTKAWTISLTTLAVFQWFNVWNCRHETKSIFRLNPFSNKYLVGTTLFVIMLQLMAIYTPLMQKFLRTAPLEASEWLKILAVGLSIILFEEIRKLIYRLRRD